jgi:hypothetical protein
VETGIFRLRAFKYGITDHSVPQLWRQHVSSVLDAAIDLKAQVLDREWWL